MALHTGNVNVNVIEFALERCTALEYWIFV